ncbi:MAG: thiol peroxidase [Bacteroidales bacterium]|nr:thiol peroxidase [Bacteroidales bacterium]
MEKHSGMITFGGNPLTLNGKLTKVGQKAEDFTVLSVDLKPVKLSDFKGKKRLISVVPSIDTGICDQQTRRFNEEAAKLENTEILTISVDLPFALGRYCATAGIDKIKTLSDHKDLDFGYKYGFVLEELRILARGIIIIDKNDVVKYVEYVSEVGEHPNYDKALEEIKNL